MVLEDGVSRYAETRGVEGMKPVEDTRPMGGSLEEGSRNLIIMNYVPATAS